MCGIVGYIGSKQALPVLLDGLEKLEYRGYDSAGVAVNTAQGMALVKAQGPLTSLKARLEGYSIVGSAGIGHTRWATHGAPSDRNAHPHTDMAGEIAVVHNGIIENHELLRRQLEGDGVVFQSETDTEVVAHLIRKYYRGDLTAAVRAAVGQLRGSWALGVVSQLEPHRLIATRKDSPLILGLGDKENLIASDVTALLKYTREVVYLQDGQIAEVTADGVRVTSATGESVMPTTAHVTWDVQAAEKAGFDHFMIKEIHEQPHALRETLSPRLKDGRIHLGVEGLSDEHLQAVSRVTIVACGTAYHAGIAAKYAIETLARVPVEVEIASEFRYRNPIIRPDDFFIVVSQSGETADTLAALRIAQEHGARVLAITNVVGSTVAREADLVFYTWAGPEIAVASTKAYLTQLMALYLFTLEFARARGTLGEDALRAHLDALCAAPDQVQRIIEQKDHIKDIAHTLHDSRDVFYMGRGADYAAAMEGSLKIKEVSYIHTEALAAGELKHGTIALIEEGTPVVAFATQDVLRDKMASNIREITARGAKVIAIANEDDDETPVLCNETIFIPRMIEAFTPMLSVVPAQMIGYYCAVERGYNPDKPRNLAKSVTVE